jgi:hypothetical protein
MNLLWTFNLALGKLFDILLYPFHKLNPFWGLALISLITGAVLVAIFKYVSNQAEIRRAKARVRGYFLEVWIYKHDFRTVIGAVGRILKANLRYMRFALAPLLVMILPVLLIMAHLNLRYGYYPFKPGDKIVLTVKSTPGNLEIFDNMRIQVPVGMVEEAGPVIAVDREEISWRLLAQKPGKYHIIVKNDQGKFAKSLLVAENIVALLSLKKSSNNSLASALFLPGERPLSYDSPIANITLKYPTRNIEFGGIRMNWLWIFFILSIVAGLALKGVFKVEI